MKVYFICYPHGPAEKSGYQHQLVAIAEGLKEQGIEPLGNVNYWLQTPGSNDWLIREYHPQSLDEFDAVVFESAIVHYKSEHLLPSNLYSATRKFKTVMIDSEDGFVTPSYEARFREIDFVFKSHYCNKFTYPENFLPWQFGLTNRIIQYVRPLPFAERKNAILSNFRVRHHLRDMVEDISERYFYPFYPKNGETDTFDEASMTQEDLLFWERTGRRHNPAYYNRLGQNKISNAVGGWIQKSISQKRGLYYKVMRKVDNVFNIFPFDRVVQFDSWRFWESLASGNCTLHVDLEKYGATFPVLPVNGEHYIGIDLAHPEKAANILKNEKQMELISEKAQTWVKENYSPLATSKRFIQLTGIS
jgi:hypothetical protein